MPDHPTLESIIQNIQKKIAALKNPTLLSHWQFYILPPSQDNPGYQGDLKTLDNGKITWQEVALPHSWSSAEGGAWFKTTLDLPPDIEGVSLVGSRLDLEILLPLGAAFYLNWKEIYREPSWADTRAFFLPLFDHYRPSQPLELAAHCSASDGVGLYASARLRFSNLDEAIFDLDLIGAQMKFTHFLTGKDDPNQEKKSLWEKAAITLDFAALAANDWPKWKASVESARGILKAFTPEAKSYTAHLIGHSHIDMNWLWPMQETIEVCRRDFATMDHLMEAYPEFRFSQSQAATYRVMETDYPELFQRMRERIAEGRWDVTASTWVEGDLNMAAGETLVRQLLYARRYLREQFGVEPLICWEPDTFGHPATYPQILKKSGIQYYYFCRAGKGYPLFWWESPDGSRLLALHDLKGYGGEIMSADVATSVISFAGRYGTRRGLFVYGVGDHGGGATARDIEAARRMDAAEGLPRALPSSTVSFYQGSQAENYDYPVVRDELNTTFEGCYTSHADIKRLNRTGENRLLMAESAAAAVAALTRTKPAVDLTEAWRTLCFHQFHDILCGCAIGVTYREAHGRMEQAISTATDALDSSLEALATHVNTTSGDGPCIVVFNPLAWERTDTVHLPLVKLGNIAPVSMVDSTGKRLAAQVYGDQVIFIASDVPSLGIQVYWPSDEPSDSTDGIITADEATNVLDNGILRLHVHPASGAIDQLYDHRASRDLASHAGGWGPEVRTDAGLLNRLQVYWEQPHPMSAWNIGDITRVDHLIEGAEVRLVEKGPVRGVIEVRRNILNSTFSQRIILYRGLRRIDFESDVEWHERGSAKGDAPMLRTSFAPQLGRTRAAFEIPFAGFERTADGREVPALRWADLSEESGSYGVSLLNDCKYGHQANGNTLGLTLIRASYEPDHNPDEGQHTFTYALYPHPGTWQEAGTIQQAAGLNQPLQATITGAHPGDIKPGFSWLRCDSANGLVSTVKAAEDQPVNGTALVIRVYETHGKAGQAALVFARPIERAEEVDLMEKPLSQLEVIKDTIHLALSPYEIKTIKVYL